MKVGMISLGCSKNLMDSEKIMGMLKKGGHQIVVDPKEADAIFVNTCGFIAPAKEEAINTVLEMSEYKQNNCKKLYLVYPKVFLMCFSNHSTAFLLIPASFLANRLN